MQILSDAQFKLIATTEAAQVEKARRQAEEVRKRFRGEFEIVEGLLVVALQGVRRQYDRVATENPVLDFVTRSDDVVDLDPEVLL